MTTFYLGVNILIDKNNLFKNYITDCLFSLVEFIFETSYGIYNTVIYKNRINFKYTVIFALNL